MDMVVRSSNTEQPGTRAGFHRRTRDRSRAIGGILIGLGRLSHQDVQAIEQLARQSGIRFGDAALQLKLVTPQDIDLALERQYNFPLLPRGGADGVADEVVAAYCPHTEDVEKLRTLRSQLTYSWLNVAERPVLTVVSPERGEGRSVLIANLATLFAQVGYRTILIDANMRRPHQHVLFNLDNSVGLSALLTSRAGKEIAKRVHPQLRLYVIPAGITPPNPHELLVRPVFKLLLDQCAAQFDVVLLDTPALTEAADAVVLSAYAGNALLVARRHHTRHVLLKSAVKKLSQAAVKVVGSVVVGH